jgi:hypothetical protein
MLLGFIIAGPTLPNLLSQEQLAKRQAKPHTGADPSLQSRFDIVLPDIYISARRLGEIPADSTTVVKERLKRAEHELQQLQLERKRILKDLQQVEKRMQQSRSDSGPGPRSADLLGRPSV